MSNRPLDDIRPFGPFISRDNDEDIEQKAPEPVQSEHRFQSMSDLPNSPMLEEYVNSLVQKTGKSELEVINSKPVKLYMQRLGVWEQVK
jgi:hypothetical protein